MDKISIPQSLPKSKIIEELTLKSEARTDLTINPLSLLDDFRKRVSQEVRQINELFPEYTPHDDEYHLSRLFAIADMVLGDALIEHLNFSELLILSLSLYGHDWGMAVSEIEKELIIKNKIKAQVELSEYVLLPDEHKKFISFLKENNHNTNTDIITQSLWQEYVRLTHANRSGERIKIYFEKINGGIGEATSRVCEAHWLDFKCLEDNLNYPTNFAILGESLNLKAISIYLRLIDLLDISEDRTPYIIWKFVTPQNLRSKLEWEKHRSIHSISASTYQDGRIIQIEGSTNNNAVYASIMDLKNFCDEQLKGCNDLLNQINTPRYNLNLFNINWRIRAIGFKPISIQFEFDRKRMFEILSDEIYQGDKYVFLREVIQNCIDAIKLRKEILEKKGGMKTSLSDFGLIEINVKHLEHGDAEIIISDNGIGMNEYILKNYLSIAGKSYYTSDDFKNLGLSMDPISKFGVGVLSCFMVADRIDIETFREPYLSTDSEKLIIQISSVTQQFKVQVSNEVNCKPGTQFKIYVSGEKLRDNSQINSIEKLDVTEYVSIIAGFVEIPIRIIENDIKTIVIGPFESEKKFASLYKGHAIKKIQFKYPWEKVFEPQCIEAAKKNFKEKIIDITNDLKFKGVSGKIISLEPIDENTIISGSGASWPATEFLICKEIIKFKEEWIEYSRGRIIREEKEKFGKSATVQSQYQVYLDGILVSNIAPPIKFENSFARSDFRQYDIISDFALSDFSFDNLFCLPYLVVNFQKKGFKPIDLSRTELIGKNGEWELSLWEKYVAFNKKRYSQKLLSLKPKERIFMLSQLIIFKRISMINAQDLLTLEKFVVPVIENKGILKFKEWKYFLKKRVYLQPADFFYFDKELRSAFEKVKKKKGKLDNWKGGEFVYRSIQNRLDDHSSQVLIISKMFREIVNKTHMLDSIRFLRSPWKNYPDLVQKSCIPIHNDPEVNIDKNTLLLKMTTDISSATLIELNAINSLLGKLYRTNFRFRQPLFCKFEKPYEGLFSHGYRYLNFNHPNVKFILQTLSNIVLHGEEKATDKIILGRLHDKLQQCCFLGYSPYKATSIASLNLFFSEVSEFYKKLGWVNNVSSLSELNKNSFVKYSIIFYGENLHEFSRYENKHVELDSLTNYSTVLK